ncbi:MAG: hypothetical protein CMJ65_17510 [Planctomycetaceae bacterium]|nr:hypothetical protein [Planctomycetaceae bacterium]
MDVIKGLDVVVFRGSRYNARTACCRAWTRMSGVCEMASGREIPMSRHLLVLLLTPALVAAQTAPPAPPLPSDAKFPSGYKQQLFDDPALPLNPKRTIDKNSSLGRRMARAWYMTGRYRMAKGDLKGGLAAFQQAVKHDGSQVAIYRDMLQVALRLNQVDDAVGYARKAVSLNPDDYQLLRWLSRQMIRQQKLAEAIQLMEQARKSKSIDQKSAIYVSVMRDLGLMYVGTGKQKAAAECFGVVFDSLQKPRSYNLDERTRRALLADPNTSYERMGQVFLAAGLTDRAVQAFRAAAKNGQGNPATLGYNLAQVFHETKRFDEALVELEKYFAKKQSSKGRSAYELLGRILEGLDKSQELIGRLEKMVGQDPENPVLQIFLADQYVAADRLDQATALYEKGVAKAKPRDREAGYWGLAVLHRRKARAAALLEALGQAVDVRGDLKRLDKELKAVAADKGLGKQVLDEAVRQAKDNQAKAAFSRRFVAARLAVQSKDKMQAVTLLKWGLASQKSVMAVKDRLLLDQFRRHIDDLARTLMVDENYTSASGLLRSAADDKTLGVFKAQFLFQLSQSYEFDGKTEEALATIGEARQTSNHPLLHYQEAWIYYHAHQWKKAVPLFEQVIKQFPKETSVVRRCQFSLSNIYVQQGDIRKGELVLEKVFSEDPENPSVNNDLGYLYADQGKKLKQAEQMIRRALKAEPENSAYQDSMGWVLFKLGRYKAALEFLEKSSAGRDGADATILEHLGDCLDKLKQADKAVEAWKQALKLAREDKRPDAKLIKRIEQKLKDAAKSSKKTS